VGARRKLGIVLAAAGLVATAACGSSGGGGGGRPSTSDITNSLDGGKGSFILGSAASSLNKDAITCIAKAIENSKLSDGAVRALVKGDTGYKGGSSDTKALTGLSTDIGKCAEAAVGGE
jgi:hypothetical protein